MTCCQHGCGAQAVVRVYWPGKVPPPVYCAEHALKAQRILEAMGCPVATTAIQDEDEEATP